MQKKNNEKMKIKNELEYNDNMIIVIIKKRK